MSISQEILKAVDGDWPVSATEIAIKLKFFKKGMDEKKRKAAIGKVVYHIRKLEREEKVRTKKIGQTIIIWPHEIEKLRVIHEMIK